MKTISRTNQFKRDYKRIIKRGCDKKHLQTVVSLLAQGQQLPPNYKDHQLSGSLKDCRECHIQPDWLLIYISLPEEIILERTGSHSDLFK